MSKHVIIVTSSYGADYIKRCGGQSYVLPIIKQAGADGVEIRRELLEQQELLQLSELAQQISAHKLICFYSVPFHLFITENEINPDIRHYFDEAKQLGAKLIKFSLGYYSEKSDLTKLKNILREYFDIQLVVENDQTECGIIAPFEAFFTQVIALSLPIKMTFDTGNWLCLEEDPQIAAQKLGQYVGYIHVKAAKLITKGKIAALPPNDLSDEWMQLINNLLPKNVVRGIEFPLEGDDLVSVSKKYVLLLKN